MRASGLWILLTLLIAACGGSPPVTPNAPAATSASATPPAKPAPIAIDGTYRGVLAGRLHLVLTLTRTSGGFSGALDSVDQNAHLPIDRVTLTDDKIHFEIASVDGAFDGKVEGARIDGAWTQHGFVQPLTLVKGEPGEALKPEPPKPPLDAPVEVTVPTAPAPLRADDRSHLVYEIHVTNLARRDVTLERVEVDGGGRSLARFESSVLASMCAHPGEEQPAGDDRLRISAGRRAVIFVWITLDGAVPAALDHRIALKLGGFGLAVNGPRVTVRDAKTPVLGPPLKGRWWKAANGPSNESHHRRAFIPIGGRVHVSQRFAIDWVKLGDDGKTFSGDPKSNASYHAYGQSALAVADGVVTEVKDGVPENTPGDSQAVPITLETIGGNHVIVDLGGGFFALWAHLQPGSVKVKLGDRVKRGQVLGLVGNSGNSTEPHLHFHVSDASSVLGSEGLPYALDAFDSRPPKPDQSASPATSRTKQLPTENELVAFP